MLLSILFDDQSGAFVRVLQFVAYGMNKFIYYMTNTIFSNIFHSGAGGGKNRKFHVGKERTLSYGKSVRPSYESAQCNVSIFQFIVFFKTNQKILSRNYFYYSSQTRNVVISASSYPTLQWVSRASSRNALWKVYYFLGGLSWHLNLVLPMN